MPSRFAPRDKRNAFARGIVLKQEVGTTRFEFDAAAR
jgi:hypothetical protein